ncbi:MAG: hypothetical protein ACJ79M_04990, partial [Myxococcales bacterium]
MALVKFALPGPMNFTSTVSPGAQVLPPTRLLVAMLKSWFAGAVLSVGLVVLTRRGSDAEGAERFLLVLASTSYATVVYAPGAIFVVGKQLHVPGGLLIAVPVATQRGWFTPVVMAA